jgi:hypothetical protein
MVNATGKQIVPPRGIQVGEQPIEIVAEEIAIDCLQGLIGAFSQLGGDFRHHAERIGPLG